MGDIAELRQRTLTAQETCSGTPRSGTIRGFIDFAGKVEINQYGDLLVNAASRPHVLLQKRLAAFLERSLGGEAVTKMPVRVALSAGAGFKLRVPDISWSATPSDRTVLLRTPPAPPPRPGRQSIGSAPEARDLRRRSLPQKAISSLRAEASRLGPTWPLM